MKLLFALLDVKTETFLAPMAAVTRGEAERSYVQILQTEGTLVNKCPGDFPLYEIGSFDERTGVVSPLCTSEGVMVLPRLLIDSATVLKLVKEG